MYFIRRACLPAFVSPKDTKVPHSFFLTHTDTSRPDAVSSRLCYHYVTLLCYAQLLMYPLLMLKLLSCLVRVRHWMESCKRTRRLFLTIRCRLIVPIPPPVPFSTVCLSKDHMDRSRREITIYFWCYHFVEKLTTMLSS